MDIYTSSEEATRLIKERWNDKALRKKVEERIGGKLPLVLLNQPTGLLGRNIGTPDGEFARFIALNKVTGTRPVVFEYKKDKLVAKNFSKYSLVKMPFYTGNSKDSYKGVVKVKIVNFDHAEGEKLSDLETLWKENLVSFHHRILFEFFPEMKNNIVDVMEIFKEEFHPREYYNWVFSLAISHSIYFEDFFSLDEEDDFVKKIVLPAFKEVMEYFDLKPIIVRISKTDKEYREGPQDMFYPNKIKDIVEKCIKNIK